MARMRFGREDFPEDFLFGVATSDHQSEAYDPRYPDIWDRWEEEKGLKRRGRAADFWNRYEEDIELARGLGCGAFRMSISWARLEPRPGEYNDEAFAHYRRVIGAIRAAGMEPISLSSVRLPHRGGPGTSKAAPGRGSAPARKRGGSLRDR